MPDLDASEVFPPSLNKQPAKPLDPEIEAWTDRMLDGTQQMAVNEKVRKAIAKRLF